jgi:hypothetical protein
MATSLLNFISINPYKNMPLLISDTNWSSRALSPCSTDYFKYFSPYSKSNSRIGTQPQQHKQYVQEHQQVLMVATGTRFISMGKGTTNLTDGDYFSRYQQHFADKNYNRYWR